MKRNIYLVAITVITIACIIFGTLYRGMGLAKYVTKKVISSDSSDATTSIDEKNIPAFSRINVDTDVAQLEIKTGDSYSCKITSIKNYPVSYTNENGVLNITQNAINVLNFGSNNITCEIVITIPKDAEITSATLNSDVGNISVEDCIINDMSIESDVGNVELSNVTFNNLTIQTDVGNIEVTDVKDIDKYNVDLSTDLGKITYCGSSSKGSLNKTVSSAKGNITIGSDVGKITLN